MLDEQKLWCWRNQRSQSTAAYSVWAEPRAVDRPGALKFVPENETNLFNCDILLLNHLSGVEDPGSYTTYRPYTYRQIECVRDQYTVYCR